MKRIGAIAGPLLIAVVICWVDYGLLQLQRASPIAMGIVFAVALALLPAWLWAVYRYRTGRAAGRAGHVPMIPRATPSRVGQ